MVHRAFSTAAADPLASIGVRPLSSATFAIWKRRFAAHEELLTRGGWTSLRRWLDGQQWISIRRSALGAERYRLTSREYDLLAAIAAGFGVKQAAAELGLEWATARTTLHRTLRKLDLVSCAHVPAFWFGLRGPGSSSRHEDGTEVLVFESRLDNLARAVSLTRAEREVLHAVLRGLDNQQIASQRSTSLRTVANQLATLFQKFAASSKGELASKALLLHLSQREPPALEERAATGSLTATRQGWRND